MAELVGQLWPSPSLNGERLAFYASALTVIPESGAAIRTVNDLFVTERWQPTPGDVIDRAMRLDAEALREWHKIAIGASDAQHRRPVQVALDPLAAAALRQVCGSLIDVPLERGPRLDKVRERFIAEYVARRRQAISRTSLSGRLEIGSGHDE